MISTLIISLHLLSAEPACAAPVLPDTNEYSVVSDSTTTLPDFFTETDAFLKKYVSNGKVDYKALKAAPAEIRHLYTTIGEMDLSAADKATQTAFYINAYNLITIYAVVEKMPITSPLDVSGFFDTKKHQIAGTYMTLNDLENKKLRPDPRVHFALVCGANGCPQLRSEAYMPATVMDQLTAATKAAMNDPNFIRVNTSTKTVAISQIFDWYKDDFIKSSGSDIAFINSYRTNKIPTDYKKEFYTYDWKLNGK